MAEHLRRIQTSTKKNIPHYLGDQIQKEIIHIISEAIKQNFLEIVKESKYYSLFSKSQHMTTVRGKHKGLQQKIIEVNSRSFLFRVLFIL